MRDPRSRLAAALVVAVLATSGCWRSTSGRDLPPPKVPNTAVLAPTPTTVPPTTAPQTTVPPSTAPTTVR